MSKMTPPVDGYIRKNKKWQDALQELRRIVLECDLTEEVKWRTPCYTNEGRNILFIGAFKDWCVLSFIKGALLKDSRKLLESAGPNSQSVRVIRFTDVQKITELQSVLKAYIREAVAVEKSGLKVEFKKTADFEIPHELQNKFDENSAFKKAFESLTPGRQRGYLLYFAGAKQSKTRASRVEKQMPRIMEGKGMLD